MIAPEHLRPRGGIPTEVRSLGGDAVRYGPWFQRQPQLTVAVSAVLFAAVTSARLALGDDATVGVTMLYALPVSLVAMAWGRIAGVCAGLLAVALVIAWVLAGPVDLSWVGWISRVVPLILIGFLLGDASRRLQHAEKQRLRHEARELRHRQAVEINDSLIQGMAAAKWSLEGGQTEAGLATLEATLDQGQKLVSELIRDADASREGR